MAKKFGKFLLFTAAAGAAAAGVFYYLKNKERLASEYEIDDDEDYDDFSDDLEDTDSSSRSYVPLNMESTASGEETSDTSFEEAAEAGDGDFSALAEKVKETAEEKVEEFFDEDDL